MPWFNGTGPRGRGPLTGRGFGKCGDSQGGGRFGKGTLITVGGLALSVFGMVVKDARDPDGVTQGLFRKVRSFASLGAGRRDSLSTPRNEREAEYEIGDERNITVDVSTPRDRRGRIPGHEE
ncbi:MAG: DUF5320 domain-containing protein [Candidatus Latescibacteria bacterium]|nr:DUF5320 domain-containing protein [Candidatus Latescibacterota bacterium]